MPTPLALVAALDVVLRDSLTAAVLLDSPSTVALRYDTDLDAGGLRRLVLDADGVVEDRPVDLDCACISCAMGEEAGPVLEALAADPRWGSVLLVLPIGADPHPVVNALAPRLRSLVVTSVTTVLDADDAPEDLLGDATLAERGLRWTAEDERSVGEALAAQLEFSDTIVLEGDPRGAGAELVSHVLVPGQHAVRTIGAVSPDMLVTGTFDHLAAHRRVDPVTVGPTREGGERTGTHGTWTLDLSSERPFDPDRLMEHIERLGSGRLRSHGCFWLPTRPGAVCQWDGAGGQLSIGTVDDWGRTEPCTHLVVTGDDPADRERVRAAFADCLFTAAEWRRGLLPWLGRADAFDPWLGERAASA